MANKKKPTIEIFDLGLPPCIDYFAAPEAMFEGINRLQSMKPLHEFLQRLERALQSPFHALGVDTDNVIRLVTAQDPKNASVEIDPPGYTPGYRIVRWAENGIEHSKVVLGHEPGLFDPNWNDSLKWSAYALWHLKGVREYLAKEENGSLSVELATAAVSEGLQMMLGLMNSQLKYVEEDVSRGRRVKQGGSKGSSKLYGNENLDERNRKIKEEVAGLRGSGSSLNRAATEVGRRYSLSMASVKSICSDK